MEADDRLKCLHVVHVIFCTWRKHLSFTCSLFIAIFLFCFQGLRFKKAHVTHPELKATFCLPILGVKKNPSSPLYTSLGVITKGTVIEVNVSELGLVTQGGKVIWGESLNSAHLHVLQQSDHSPVLVNDDKISVLTNCYIFLDECSGVYIYCISGYKWWKRAKYLNVIYFTP